MAWQINWGGDGTFFFFLQIKACRGGLQIAQMVKSRKKNKIDLQGIQKLEELT